MIDCKVLFIFPVIFGWKVYDEPGVGNHVGAGH